MRKCNNHGLPSSLKLRSFSSFVLLCWPACHAHAPRTNSPRYQYRNMVLERENAELEMLTAGQTLTVSLLLVESSQPKKVFNNIPYIIIAATFQLEHPYNNNSVSHQRLSELSQKRNT